MRIHVPALLLILAACSEPSPMLHELDSYAGTVELSGAGGGAISGRLTFDRVSGNLQFQLRDPEVVSLVEGPAGELRAFAGEQWRAASDSERAAFELVAAAVRYQPTDRETPMSWEDGYKISVAGRELGIRLLTDADPHRVR